MIPETQFFPLPWTCCTGTSPDGFALRLHTHPSPMVFPSNWRAWGPFRVGEHVEYVPGTSRLCVSDTYRPYQSRGLGALMLWCHEKCTSRVIVCRDAICHTRFRSFGPETTTSAAAEDVNFDKSPTTTSANRSFYTTMCVCLVFFFFLKPWFDTTS